MGRRTLVAERRSAQVMGIREGLGLPDAPGGGLPGVPRVSNHGLVRHHSGGFSEDAELDAVSIGSRSTVRASPYDAASDVSSVRTGLGVLMPRRSCLMLLQRQRVAAVKVWQGWLLDSCTTTMARDRQSPGVIKMQFGA